MYTLLLSCSPPLSTKSFKELKDIFGRLTYSLLPPQFGKDNKSK